MVGCNRGEEVMGGRLESEEKDTVDVVVNEEEVRGWWKSVIWNRDMVGQREGGMEGDGVTAGKERE